MDPTKIKSIEECPYTKKCHRGKVLYVTCGLLEKVY
jgi:hypothetical protein